MNERTVNKSRLPLIVFTNRQNTRGAIAPCFLKENSLGFYPEGGKLYAN